jgi:hypothetical protein
MNALPLSSLGTVSQYTGIPTGQPKRRMRGSRGKGGKGLQAPAPSTKPSAPGAALLKQLVQAHTSGNFGAAKTHALNFANAMHQHTTGGGGQSVSGGGAGAIPAAAAGALGSADTAPANVSTPAPSSTAPAQPENGNTGEYDDPPDTGGVNPRHWISGAIKHPGALHRELGVPQGKTIPAAKIAKAAHSDNPTLARRARLAETLKAMHHG